MRFPPLLLAAVCLTSAAFAQSAEKRFQFGDSSTLQDLQELATVFRTVFDFTDVSLAQPSHSITVRGTAGQVAGAEWFVHDLEAPAEIRARSSHTFALGGKLPVVRAFYLTSPASERAQYVQELLTVIRTIAGVQKIFNVTRSHAIVMRDEQPGIDMTSWLIDEFEARAQSQQPGYTGIHQFKAAVAGPDILRIFYPDDPGRPAFATLVKPLRADLRIDKVFLTSAPAVLVIRGTPDQLAAAEKMIGVR